MSGGLFFDNKIYMFIGSYILPHKIFSFFYVCGQLCGQYVDGMWTVNVDGKDGVTATAMLIHIRTIPIANK